MQTETVSRSRIGSDENDIRYGIRTLQRCVHALAVEKGWYDPPKTVIEAIALMHSELSEALEELRSFPQGSLELDEPRHVVFRVDITGKPLGLAPELADCVIRILDTCEHLGIDLADAILKKHSYNQSRPHRRGEKSA